MNHQKISIIIPVYNVEAYLDECMESVVAQTYEKLEIILVDDGSADGSGELCDKWAQKDMRIKVIHQENRGLSAARNAGLKIATGTYIGYVDSDDVIHPSMYEYLLTALEANEADVAICHELAFEGKVCSFDVPECYHIESIENREQLMSHFMDDYLSVVRDKRIGFAQIESAV